MLVLFLSSCRADKISMAFQEGFTKLWTGLGPNVARNAIINAAELASYDQVKQVGCSYHSIYLHFVLIQGGN